MTSKQYWKRRSILLEQLLHDRAEATAQRISRLYGLAQERIFERIEQIFSAYTEGGSLTEAEALRLLSARETAEAEAALRQMYLTAQGPAKKAIWARLSAPAYSYRISRLQALRDELYAQARMVGLEEVGYVRDRLSDTLEQSYYRTTFDHQHFTGEYYDFDRLTDRQIKAALAADWNGKNWSSRIWDNNRMFADAVEDTVTVGIMTGQRYAEMRDNLMHVIGLDDTEGARYRSARLVQTECAYVANQGHLMGYQAAEIEKYIFLATLDLRTSEICRSLDGKRFPVDEAQPGTNFPPMHPWCRSTTMPDMSAEQLRKVKRAARDPKTGKSITVPGDMTYREWYRKYVEGAENPVADFRKMKYNAPEKWDEQQIEIAHQTIEQAILKGPENDDFGAVLRKNHIGLSKYTPETMKKALEQAGFVVRPLNRGNFKGVPFEQGGGYKTNYGGNGIFQYHPPARSHHGGAYWKISDTKEQERYGMDGTKK